ncbi:MAG TPA: polysaccharide deacetylase family protein [Candidatus Ventrousia excrementavium]|uniref:Polysaccharide deacetylase family protein n=1 Tax=Candidatus Ventrousia excrementavium TaxID=2840961 RepID=A0A9D1IS97_9CLOT|nr:polysaccharide deacetylase family protein [Candidatus Ventrousia excrementavium]
MSKHVMERRRKRKPMWPLLLLAVIAAVFAVWALVSALRGTLGNTDPDAPPAQSDEQQPGPDEPKTEDQLAAERQALLDEAALLAKGYFYDEAIAALQGAGELQNAETDAELARIQGLKDSLVKYEGQLYHVFFHSLIVYPELAFDDKGHPAEGYNMWMTTVSEFKAMLPLFLENDFVLYDITEMMELDENGMAQRKDIYLPEGKKPLVISIDDVSYYDYMLPDGFAQRLVINEAGDVVTEVKAPDGTVSQTYDGDVMPIVDQFVKEHPEFSYRGAKGIVAPTGYQGAFGYRITDPDWFTEAEFKQLCDDVKAIAARLRETGWQIGCHSYTHNSFWRGDMTLAEVKDDLDRWKSLMEPYVGETNILITPFGGRFDVGSDVYDYIVNELGFNIICPVGSGMPTSYEQGSMMQDRLNLDGYTMIKHPERVSKFFFDPTPIIDPARPPLD